MRKISRNALVAVTAIAGVVGLGAAGAIAANGVLSPEDNSKAIIDDAASQLGVQPDELSSALKQAMKNRIDAAVDAGRLTREQGKELKARIDAEEFPLLGYGPHGGPGFHGGGLGHFGNGEVIAAAASYLDLTEAELREQLDGKTLADVAKEQDKSVSGLVDAMVGAAEKDIDHAVADGKLTQSRATELKSRLEERMTDLVDGELRHGPGMHGLGPMGDRHMGRHSLFQGPPA